MWELQLNVERGLLRVIHDPPIEASEVPEEEREIRLDDLPVVVDGYEIRRGKAANSAVVVLVVPPDIAFRHTHPSFESSTCTPRVADDFIGIALAGPKSIAIAETIREDRSDDWMENTGARFVVAGEYVFDPTLLAKLDRDPLDAIVLVIENTATGVVKRDSISSLNAAYTYEIEGINVSPAPAEPFVGYEPDPDLASVGGSFHVGVGHFAGEPTEAFDLKVHAEWDELRSEQIVIRIEP